MEGNTMKITTAQQQGLRPYQEDTYGVFKYPDGGTLLAVFDGHGGKEASTILGEFLKSTPNPIWTLDKSALGTLFKTFDALTELCKSGTTASLVYITPDHNKAYVAVLGDSPVIIFDKNNNIWTSPEHNVRTNGDEVQKVLARGGNVYNGYAFKKAESWGAQTQQGLQLSRAFGNYGLREILSQEPELFEIELGPYSWVLVASDGLLDPGHKNTEERINQIVTMVTYGGNAETLVNNAIEKKTGDNVSAIVAHINAIQTHDNLAFYGTATGRIDVGERLAA